MSEIDLDRLGDVWRGQPDPEEIARVQRSANAVRRSARFGQFTDVGLAIVVSAVVLALVISNARLETGVAGGAAILLILFSMVRQRRLRRLELATLAGSTEHMLDQSIARTQATIRRARFNLWTTPLGFPLGIAFGAALDRGEGSGPLQRLAENPTLRLVAAVVLSLAVAAIYAHFLRIRAQSTRELERLVQLRQAYDAENASE